MVTFLAGMQIRETPHRSHHKFIEFYDVRAAEAALRALNRSDIAGKQIKLEPSRPGGTRRYVFQAQYLSLVFLFLSFYSVTNQMVIMSSVKW